MTQIAKKILVVDDEPINLELITEFLPTEYEVHTANNGKEALAKVEEVSPDLILLDVMMPGIDGYEVCRKLKNDSRTLFIPVVMVTALSDTENRIQAIEAGADDFLSKPVDMYELNARVKSLLRVKQYHDDLEEMKSRYMELYDFAPVGYFTFTRDGIIREANMIGAVLLGVLRQELINTGFERFVVPEDQKVWNSHLSDALNNWQEQSCELKLRQENDSTLFVRLSSVRMETMDAEPEVRTVMTDLTQHENK